MEYQSTKEEKFDSIYRALADQIFKVAMHYAKDYYTAQEITQMAFVKLYKHMDNVKPECIKSWLIVTVKNILFNQNRNSKHEMLEEAVGVIMESKEPADYSDNLDRRYVREEQKRLAEELYDSIFDRLYRKSPDWYDAVMLVYCLEKPQKEAARELGISIEVLHSRLYRAKQWIRKNYEKEYEEVVSWL